MYRVLKKNWERLDVYIEGGLDLRLGVADKCLLKKHLSENDHSNFSDLWRDTTEYLWNMGYRSEQFKKLHTSEKKMELDWIKSLLHE